MQGRAVEGLRAPPLRPSARIRPWSSVGTRMTRSRPRPSIWSAAKIVTCAPSLTTTGELRRTEQALALDVPARPAEQPVAAGREARERRHRRAGRVADARALAGSPNSSTSQRAGDLLGDRGRRADRVQPGVLVPRAASASPRRAPPARRRRSRTRSSAVRRWPTRPPSAFATSASTTATGLAVRPAAYRRSGRGARRRRRSRRDPCSGSSADAGSRAIYLEGTVTAGNAPA